METIENKALKRICIKDLTIPTNVNGLKGARMLKDALNSSVEIYDMDLDSRFVLPKENYDLVLFFGTLYHLKNPFYILEYLSTVTKFCFISTRIAKMSPDKKMVLADLPLAYLLDEKELNNDSSNYWIFSDKGLRRLLYRTGWDICDYMTVGNRNDSDPVSQEGDERAFCLVKSRKSV